MEFLYLWGNLNTTNSKLEKDFGKFWRKGIQYIHKPSTTVLSLYYTHWQN